MNLVALGTLSTMEASAVWLSWQSDVQKDWERLYQKADLAVRDDRCST